MYSHTEPRNDPPHRTPPEFVVEIYTPRDTAKRAAARIEDAALAADQVSARTAEVRFVHGISPPEDETCFYLYEATSAEAVREAVRRAQLRLVRISEGVSMRPQGGRR
jgi:Protein of unknown function (DUF4242)